MHIAPQANTSTLRHHAAISSTAAFSPPETHLRVVSCWLAEAGRRSGHRSCKWWRRGAGQHIDVSDAAKGLKPWVPGAWGQEVLPPL
jgi:hypothetical protein